MSYDFNALKRINDKVRTSITKMTSVSAHRDMKYLSKRGTQSDVMSTKDPKLDDIESLYDLLRDSDNLLSFTKFFGFLRSSGIIVERDARFRDLLTNLKVLVGSQQDFNLDLVSFQNLLPAKNVELIARAALNQLIVPNFEEFKQQIEAIYLACKDSNRGKVADYIPQLAKMNGDYWGVSVCSIDGQRHSFGDSSIPFTLQSCSKPFIYGLALDRLGPEVVHRYVGFEPSGRIFNKLLLGENNLPHNPMMNSGAIMVCSLLQSLTYQNLSLAEKFDLMLNYFRSLSGLEYLEFCNSVYMSEFETGDRNFALAHYMKDNKCYPENSDMKTSLNLYFQVCSLEVTAESGAVMAATLANAGECPITGEQVLKPESVRDVLSVMQSSGMYDYSGRFSFRVGLPAKSGVGGGVLLVIPGVMGICTFSPLLEEQGNSAKGLDFAKLLVKKFVFHPYDHIRLPSSRKTPRQRSLVTQCCGACQVLYPAASGDLPLLKQLFSKGYDLNVEDYESRTAMHLAASHGHFSVVKFLLKHFYEMSLKQDRNGRYPIDEARLWKHKMVEDLLANYKPSKVAAATK